MQALTIAVQVILVGGVLYLGTGFTVLLIQAAQAFKSGE